MSGQDVIALAIAAGAVVFTVRFLWRSMTGNEGCSSCPSAAGKEQIETLKLKRTPLVSLDTSTLKQSQE